MMESTAFFNAKASTSEVSLFLDIDPKTDIIKEFFFDGPGVSDYKIELEEIKSVAHGRTIEFVKNLKRHSFSLETKLAGGELPVMPRGLWLLREALVSYTGEGGFLKEQTDLICLCFSVTKKDIVKKVLANKDFELKSLIQETMASSACGTCRPVIEKLIIQTRAENGLIKGLDHSKSRFDEKGNWIKIAGMYPGPLLIKLDELKNKWMEREKIVGQYEIEFTDIEGFHLTVKINSTSDKITGGLLHALSDYLKSELGVLFFLKTASL
ncbi:MAG: (2Fe-2S)-binding protein [Rhizobacter sp.]|nr:(2Fe-2S)-binding protein [Bacteriovorax sp.]